MIASPGEHQRASVLMLMPAGLLVVLLLGAISFDLSLLFLRQRQASSTAADIANDLASAALDDARFRSTGSYVLDPERAASLGASLAEASDVGEEIRSLDVTVLGDDAVEVTIVLEVDYVFAQAIPGAADSATVQATATATAVATSG